MHLSKRSSQGKARLQGPRLALPQKQTSAVVDAKVQDKQTAPLAETPDGART